MTHVLVHHVGLPKFMRSQVLRIGLFCSSMLRNLSLRDIYGLSRMPNSGTLLPIQAFLTCHDVSSRPLLTPTWRWEPQKRVWGLLRQLNSNLSLPSHASRSFPSHVLILERSMLPQLRSMMSPAIPLGSSGMLHIPCSRQNMLLLHLRSLLLRRQLLCSFTLLLELPGSSMLC